MHQSTSVLPKGSKAHTSNTLAPNTHHENGAIPAGSPNSARPSHNGAVIEPLDVSSTKELDDIVCHMLPAFEGRESETNWTARERNIITLRRLTQGNAPYAFSTHFAATMKSLLDSIYKVVNSLRTTLCTTACALLQELARTLGPKMDSWIDIMMNNLLKLCSNMKKLTSQAANETIAAIIDNLSYSSRLTVHILSAAGDKNTQVRLFAAGWIRSIILRHGGNPAQFDHSGGVDSYNAAINKGLSDANPGVREAMRKAFWAFASTWPSKALE